MEAYSHQARQRGPEEVPVLTPIVTKPDAAGDLTVVRGLAKILDEAVTIPGTNRKIGLDAILGLIPGVGDLGSAAVGGYILMVASKLGVPAIVLWRMLLNLGIDTAVGAIPFAGDLFDAAYKANTKNANLLLRAVENPAAARRSSRWVVALVGAAFLAITAAGLFATFLLVRWLWGAAG